MMKATIALAIVLLLSFAPAHGAATGDVYLGSVTGLTNGNILVESSGPTSVEFVFNFRNNDAAKAKGITNGFEFAGSDSSVTWDDLDYWLHPSVPLEIFGDIFFTSPWWHGNGADTIGFGYSVIVGPGLPGGYDGPTLVFTVTMSDTASVGGEFCIDSCYFPPHGTWMWAFGAAGSAAPTWDGPHCYPIIGTCCFGQRGNVDGSLDDVLDISDLVYLVDYEFTGGPVPPCWEEADIDGSGGTVIDIVDLIHLADFMFLGEAPPADCP